MSRKKLATAVAAAAAGLGALALTVGATMIYPPAGLIVTGLLLLAVGLLPDWGA